MEWGKTEIIMIIIVPLWATFDIACEILDPIVWRLGEFNAAADYIVNCVPHWISDVDTIDQARVQTFWRQGIGVKVFCDSG